MLVLDCIGIQATYDIGAKVIGLNSQWIVFGLGGGVHEFKVGSIPFGVSLCTPYWGGRSELMKVLALAQNKAISITTTEFPISQALDFYKKLDKSEIEGRAVLIP